MIALFQKMRIWQKLVMISAAFLLPISVMIGFIISGFNGKIKFAELEKDGCVYLRPLVTLVDQVPQHQLLTSRFLNGDTGIKEQILNLQSQIDSTLAALDAVDRKLGQTLQFSDEALAKAKRVKASVVKQKWQDLKSKYDTLKPEACDELHTQLIADIQGMVVHAGDKSNLILDPDLDSYYLMSVVLIDIPQNQDRMARVIEMGEGILRRKAITQAERSQLDTQAAFLKENGYDRINSESQTALLEDENSYGVSESLQNNLPAALNDFSSASDVFIKNLRAIASTETVNRDAAEFVAVGTKAREATFKMWKASIVELESLLNVRMESFRQDRLWSLLLSGMALAAASVLVFVIMRSINRPLTVIISSLSASGEQVASAAKQLTSSSQQLASGASEQASSIEETSSSLEEMSSMTKQNADNASQARSLVEKTRQSAQEADAVMNDMNRAMAEIKSASDEVGKIIKTIDEIAFQTNLLALNAAVEAARAGEAGKGFAVVAEEVRNLAQRSASAAKESAAKIEAAVVKSNLGVETAKKVAVSLAEIGLNVKKANDLVSEIAAASQEQAQGIGQVNVAVQQMDKVVQSNAANAEESASASEEMAAQAQSVREAVDELARMVGILSTQPSTKNATAHVASSRCAPANGNGASRINTLPLHTPLTRKRPAAEELIPMAEAEEAGQFKRF